MHCTQEYTGTHIATLEPRPTRLLASTLHITSREGCTSIAWEGLTGNHAQYQQE